MKDCEKSTPEAIKKAEEVVEFSKPFFETEPFSTYDKACEGIRLTAVKFKGEYLNTGGGNMCAVMPFDKYQCIGVSEECVVLYRSEAPKESYNIFFEDDGTSEHPLYYQFKIPVVKEKYVEEVALLCTDCTGAEELVFDDSPFGMKGCIRCGNPTAREMGAKAAVKCGECGQWKVK